MSRLAEHKSIEVERKLRSISRARGSVGFISWDFTYRRNVALTGLLPRNKSRDSRPGVMP
jgi:hypothetical protein